MKYRDAGRRDASSSLYSKLPETLDTRHAKEASQLQSQVTCCAVMMSHWTHNNNHLCSVSGENTKLFSGDKVLPE